MSELKSLAEGENLSTLFFGDDSFKRIDSDLLLPGRNAVHQLARKEWHYFSKNNGKPWTQLANPDGKVFGVAFTPEAGHYIQMMWAETTHVGCANVLCNDLIDEKGRTFSDLNGEGFKYFFTVCRYKVQGNIRSRFTFFDRTFDKSKIASKCPYGNENGLCLPEGYTPPAACNWNPAIEENVEYKVYNAKYDAVFDLWWGAPDVGRTIKTSGASWSYGDSSERFNFVRDEKTCNYLITVGGYAVSDLGDEFQLVEINAADEKHQFQIETENGSVRIRAVNKLYFTAKSASAVVVPEAYNSNDAGQVWQLLRW